MTDGFHLGPAVPKAAPAQGCPQPKRKGGRGGGIRTHDLVLPKHVRYRCATPRRIVLAKRTCFPSVARMAGPTPLGSHRTVSREPLGSESVSRARGQSDVRSPPARGRRLGRAPAERRLAGRDLRWRHDGGPAAGLGDAGWTRTTPGSPGARSPAVRPGPVAFRQDDDPVAGCDRCIRDDQFPGWRRSAATSRGSPCGRSRSRCCTLAQLHQPALDRGDEDADEVARHKEHAHGAHRGPLPR